MTSAVQPAGTHSAHPTSPWLRTRNAYRRRRWVVIGVLVLIAMVLGAIGLGQIKVNSPEQVIPVFDRFYLLISLFRFSTPPSEFPLPATLEVARWLAPFTLLLAGLGAASSIFTEQLSQIRVYLWFRNHVVICGAGRVGMRLTNTFRLHGKRVVLIDHDPLVSYVEECREIGVPVLKGDATDPVILGRARIQKARYLIAVSGDDGTNAQIALIANSDGKRKRDLNCYVNVSDGELSMLLNETAPVESTGRLVQYRFFNIFQEASRALLKERPQILRGDGDRPPSLFVVGGSPIGTNLVVDAVHSWQIEHREDDPHLRITLVDKDAQSLVLAIHERRPSLKKVCDLAALALDPWDPYSSPFKFSTDGQFPVPTAAIVCPLDDTAGLRASMKLRRALPADVPIFVCTTGRRDTGPLLDLASAGVLRQVHGFPVLDRVCDQWVDLILDGPSISEDLARGIHAHYVRHRLRDGKLGDPSMVPWDSLSEDLRESNRHQASEFRRKLHSIGLTYVLAGYGQAPPFEFTNDQIEELAIMEHDRWIVERLGAGWTYSKTKDPKNKLSPDLICWSCLADDIRELDREAMRVFPEILSHEGYVIVPLDEKSGLVAPSEGIATLDPSWSCPVCHGANQTSASA